MIWCIIGPVLYVAIGLFICGFLDITIGEDLMPWCAVVLLWSVITVMFIIAVVGRIPILLGKKLGDIYRPIVENMLNKLFN